MFGTICVLCLRKIMAGYTSHYIDYLFCGNVRIDKVLQDIKDRVEESGWEKYCLQLQDVVEIAVSSENENKEEIEGYIVKNIDQYVPIKKNLLC